jgi:hypothetical protein
MDILEETVETPIKSKEHELPEVRMHLLSRSDRLCLM